MIFLNLGIIKHPKMEDKKIPTPEQVHEYRRILESDEYELHYKAIEKFEDEYDLSTVVFEEDGKCGLKDAAGDVLIPAIYDEIGYTFHDNFRDKPVAVLRGEKAALVKPDGKGTPITNFEYDDISLVGSPTCPYEEFYLITIGEKCGLFDVYGNICIPMGADEIFEPHYDTIPYMKDGKYGFASISIGKTTDAIYDDYEYKEEYLVVIKDGERGHIDIEGQFTTDPEKKYFNYIDWHYKAIEEGLDMGY